MGGKHVQKGTHWGTAGSPVTVCVSLLEKGALEKKCFRQCFREKCWSVRGLGSLRIYEVELRHIYPKKRKHKGKEKGTREEITKDSCGQVSPFILLFPKLTN